MDLNKTLPIILIVVSHIGSMPGTRKHKILVAGKRLNLGVRGTRREALLGGDKISGTGGSHPGQES